MTKSTEATSVAKIILAINVVVSTLFIKIRDGGETLKYNIWWSIAETRFFSHTVHRILREFHRVALNILLHYPLWRLQYWHFSVIFMIAFLSWKELECWKRNNANDGSYGIDVFRFFIPTCRCPVWRINAFFLSCFHSVIS